MTGVVRRWVRDLVIGFRLTVGGSRNPTTSWVRLGVGAFGIALAVAVLLGAGSAGSVLAERDARGAAQAPSLQPRTDVAPTYLRSTGTLFRGEYIGGTFVQHTDETSPVPPGVPRQLGPGEMVVSPELRALLAGPGGELLRDRFTGFRIVGEIAKPGLRDPGELRFVSGSRELAAAGEEAGVQRVYGFGGPSDETPMPFVLVVLVVLAAVVLIVPLLIFVQTSSRIAGAERDRRLAAVRLVGGDARQVRRIAAAEALLPAAAGLLLGAAVFFAVRPLAGQIELFGVSVYPEDIVPAWWAVGLVVLAVPVLSVATALVAMRRTVVEPLGVVRHGKPRRRRTLWWRLGITAAGVALLIASATVLRRGFEESTLLTAIAAGGILLVLGVASLLPWAVELIIGRAHGGPPTLQLAARRLQLDAGTSARVVSGIVVVLTGAVSVLLVLGSVQREYEAAVDLVDQQVSEWPTPMVHVPTDARRLAEIGAKLETVPGVRGVHPAAEVLIGGVEEKGGVVLVGECFALQQHVGVDGCADGDVFLPAGAASEPGVRDLAPGDHIPVGDRQWRVPQAAKMVTGGESYIAAYATPRAFGPVQARSGAVSTVYLDAKPSGFLEAVELQERVRNAVGLEPDVWVSAEGGLVDQAEAQTLESVRSWIFAGSVVVLTLAALSVLVLAVEQVRERRRALAAVAAAGVGFGTLARSLLWQNAIPFGIGSLLAVGGGYVLAYLVLQIPGTSMAPDWASVGLLVGAAAALMLLVTLLSLPMLRAAVSVRNLRTE